METKDMITVKTTIKVCKRVGVKTKMKVRIRKP